MIFPRPATGSVSTLSHNSKARRRKSIVILSIMTREHSLYSIIAFNAHFKKQSWFVISCFDSLYCQRSRACLRFIRLQNTFRKKLLVYFQEKVLSLTPRLKCSETKTEADTFIYEECLADCVKALGLKPGWKRVKCGAQSMSM